MTKYILDVSYLLCPMPVIKTQNKAKELTAGDELEVICTDPGALQDIPAWCRIFNHEVIESLHLPQEKKYIITIKIADKNVSKDI